MMLVQNKIVKTLSTLHIIHDLLHVYFFLQGKQDFIVRIVWTQIICFL